MIMFPYDGYLQLAKDLTKKSDEAYLRSSVSRAYYACFHLVKDYAEKQGEYFKGSSLVHDEVIAFLNNNTDPVLQSIGPTQSRLRSDRTTCDYKKVRNLSSITPTAISNAERIFSVIKSKKAVIGR